MANFFTHTSITNIEWDIIKHLKTRLENKVFWWVMAWFQTMKEKEAYHIYKRMIL